MKKIILSLAALAAVSTAALAERNYDLRDSDTYFGKYSNNAVQNDINALESRSPAAGVIYYGQYGTTMDPAEARRWDEKNGGSLE